MLTEYETEQKIAVKILKNSVKKNMISHAYLIETNNYDKKDEMGIAIAKFLLCHHTIRKIDCPVCMNDKVENIPDIKIIKPEGQAIKKVNMEELQKEFSKKSISSGKRVYIITNAEKLNASSANSILKFLEEPEDNIYALIMVDNLYQVLPTIVSRCQVLKFASNDNYTDGKNIETILKKNFLIKEDEEINEIIEIGIKLIKNMEADINSCYLNMNTIIPLNNITKENLVIYLEIIILIYKDVLNYLCDRKVEIFINYLTLIKEISNKNNNIKICDKINIINETKENINFNINTNILVDCMFKSLKEVK